MNCTLEEYIQNVKSQLCVNQMGPVDYITYNYSNELVDQHINYFEYQLKQGLSAYKALLFFHDYLDEGMDITSYMIVEQPEQTYATDWRHLQ